MDARKLTNIFLGIIVTIAIIVVLKQLQTILKPFLIALFLSYLAEPLVRLLKKRFSIPRYVSIIVVLLIAFFALSLIGLLIYTSVDSFTSEFPKYEQKFKSMLHSLITLSKIPEEDIQSYIKSLNWHTYLNQFSITKFISSSIGTFFNFLLNLLIILIFLVYNISGKDKLGIKLSLVFSNVNTKKINDTMHKINYQVERYIVTKIILNFVEATLITLVLIIFNVDLAIFWGLLTFLMAFIPNIGTALSIIFPITVAFLQYGSFYPPILVFVLVLGIQTINGNIVEPRVMGLRLNLSPLMVLISLIFWGWLWGPVGAILSVPITATLKIFFENIESLRPINIFLTGKINKKHPL